MEARREAVILLTAELEGARAKLRLLSEALGALERASRAGAPRPRKRTTTRHRGPKPPTPEEMAEAKPIDQAAWERREQGHGTRRGN